MTNYVRNFFGHLHTINTHRRLVREHCFKAGIPVQGLLHDLSKYHPVEFLAGVKYYVGDHSPNVEERRDTGYSAAWLHHKGRNKHHFEYWFDNGIGVFELVSVEMPLKYIKEMFCDRVAASKIYNGASYTDADPYTYFLRIKGKHRMHENTEELLNTLLEMLRDDGEETTFAYIKGLKKKAR